MKIAPQKLAMATKDCRRSRFLERVLAVVSNLGALRGSSAKEILNYLLNSCVDKSGSRNLTLQLQKALKHAVISGLLKLQGGRYKICKSSNPATTPAVVKPKSDAKTKTTKTKTKTKKKKKKLKNSRRRQERTDKNSSAASKAEKSISSGSRSSAGKSAKK